MYCPKCGNEMFCPCDVCSRLRREENGLNAVAWGYDIKRDTVACGNCGLQKHISWWKELETNFFTTQYYEIDNNDIEGYIEGYIDDLIDNNDIEGYIDDLIAL